MTSTQDENLVEHIEAQCKQCRTWFSYPKRRGRPPAFCKPCYTAAQNKKDEALALRTRHHEAKIQRAREAVRYLDEDPEWVKKLRDKLRED